MDRCSECASECVRDEEGWQTYRCGAVTVWTEEGRDTVEACPRSGFGWCVAQAERLRDAGNLDAADVIARLVDEIYARDFMRIGALRMATRPREGKWHRTISHAKFELSRLEPGFGEVQAAAEQLGLSRARAAGVEVIEVATPMTETAPQRAGG